MTARPCALLLSLASILAACSSSSSGSSSTSCGCNITYNGAQRSVACGTDTCLNGASFSCSASSAVTQGGACTENTGTADSGTPSTTKDSGSTTETCNYQRGFFRCGTGSRAPCAKDTDYCVVGEPTVGEACKSIGGTDGDTCPRCSNILPLATEWRSCGTQTPTCSGDETTGVTITCN